MFRDLYKGACVFADENFSWLFKGIKLEWEKELEEAVTFTNLGVTAKQVTVLAWFLAVVMIGFTLLGVFVSFFLGINPLFALLLGMVFAVALLFFIPEYPKRLMVTEKMACLGYAPHLIAYLIIPLKQDPNLEKAVKFAAESSEDRLTKDLKELLWSTWAGKYNSVGEALPFLGLKWGEHIKGFRDALYAIRASQIEKHEARRLATLDRALKDLLSNINMRFQEFINELRLPTMVLFMGGVMIPMLVVMFIPILYMMGFELGKPIGVVAILSLIVVGVFIVSEFILTKRPVSFAPIKVPDNHPGLPSPGKVRIGNREESISKISWFILLFFSSMSVPYAVGYGEQSELINQLNYLPVVVGLFAGAWVYFYFDSKDREKIRKQIERAEEDCIEACFHIGNRLMSGVPAEEALIRVSEMLEGPVKDSMLARILEGTVRNIRYTNMGLKDAFFNPERGSLRDVHSGLIHGLFKMFSNSMERGVEAAAETLINSTMHFRDIRRVESKMREQMSYTTSMIKVSSSMIAPALCALSIPLTEIFIAIIDRIEKQNIGNEYITDMGFSMIKKPELTPDILTLILGVYMLIIIIVLIRFTTILEYGNDEVRIKVEIAKALPIALVIFVFVLTLGRIFFAQMIAA